ncbi:MAG: hypothetical protein V1720_16710 [bacterium]
MRRLLLLSTLFLATISFIISCKEDPTSAGVDLIPGEDFFQNDSVDSFTDSLTQSSRTYTEKIELGASERILLGKFDNMETEMLVRYAFVLPDSLEDPLTDDSLIVRDAWIEMISTYRLGDTLSTFDFSLHDITSDWSASGFDKDSLAALQYNEINISSKSITDTLIKFNINPDIPFRWLKKIVDDDLADNYGLLFKPASFVNQIIGFPSYPNYENNLVYMVVEKPGSFIDTLIAEPYLDIHVVQGTAVEGTTTTEYLQAGFSSRVRLQIDLPSDLPAGTIINRAELELTADPDLSINGNPSTDSIYVYIFKDSTDTLYYDDRAALLIRDGNKFTGTVTSLVQSWLNGIENYGFRLHLLDESKSLSRIAIKSSGAVDLADRPRLKLIYTHK